MRGAITIMVMTGCPAEFCKDGRVSKAVQQDTQEYLLFLDGCDEEVFEEICTPDKWHSDECVKRRQGGVR